VQRQFCILLDLGIIRVACEPEIIVNQAPPDLLRTSCGVESDNTHNLQSSLYQRSHTMLALIRWVDSNPAQLKLIFWGQLRHTGLRKMPKPIVFGLIFYGCSCGEAVVVVGDH